MQTTPPTVPVAPWLGGKSRLAKRIIQRLERIDHSAYVEPFIGMGGVFLRRPFQAKAEVINDLNTDIANLFRILQRHYVALMDELKWRITSRAEFERLRAARPETLTDLERAARFLYLQRLRFGGKPHGSFGVSPQTPARFDITKLAATLEAVHERLAGVVIEQLPYTELIRRYDKPETLFYLDPPYFGCEDDYGDGLFTPQDFETLARILAGLKGRFLLSLNDHPEIRRIFQCFTVEAVSTTYTISNQRQKPATELLISG
jgi:DNA adenine methylase